MICRAPGTRWFKKAIFNFFMSFWAGRTSGAWGVALAWIFEALPTEVFLGEGGGPPSPKHACGSHRSGGEGPALSCCRQCILMRYIAQHASSK